MYKEVCSYGIIIDNAVMECSALNVIVFKLSENAARANPRNDQLKSALFQIKKTNSSVWFIAARSQKFDFNFMTNFCITIQPLVTGRICSFFFQRLAVAKVVLPMFPFLSITRCLRVSDVCLFVMAGCDVTTLQCLFFWQLYVLSGRSQLEAKAFLDQSGFPHRNFCFFEK